MKITCTLLLMLSQIGYGHSSSDLGIAETITHSLFEAHHGMPVVIAAATLLAVSAFRAYKRSAKND